MSGLEEKDIINILREHSGGLGESLSDEQRRVIIEGIENRPENDYRFSEVRFKEGLKRSIENNPLEWV